MSDQPSVEQGRERLAGSEEPRRGVGTMLRGNLPIFVVAGLVLASFVGYLALSGGGAGDPPPVSRAPQAPMLDATQRGNELSPEFRRQIQAADAVRAEDALRQGGSALPTPVFEGGPPRLPAPEAPASPEPATQPPPLPVRPAELPPPLPFEPPPVAAQTPTRPPMTQQDMSAMLQAMQRQAEAASLRPFQAAATTFFEVDAGGGNGRAGEGQPQIPATSIRPGEGGDSSGEPGLVPPPGTILYARMLGRANSDVPGPVVAEVLQGELLGARLVGQFQAGRDGLLIQFRTMTIPARNGRPPSVVQIEAVAVDTDNLGASLATSVNRRELERIALAFGTAFMRGLGQAVAQSGAIVSQGLTGTIVQNRTLNTRQQLVVGAGAAAGAAGDVIQDIYGNRPPTIIVEAGTPFGLLFLGSR